MKQPIPFEKLSKREKKKHCSGIRGDWGACNPITRCSRNEKAYKRKEKYSKTNWDASLLICGCRFTTDANSYGIALLVTEAHKESFWNVCF